MKTKLFNQKVVAAVRVLLGLNLFSADFFILFGFVQLPPSSPAAESFIKSLIDSGYLWQLIKIVEIIAGLALVINRFTPFALVVIAPITLNIFLFNTILWPQGAASGIFVLLANIYLLFAFLPNYKSVLAVKPA